MMIGLHSAVVIVANTVTNTVRLFHGYPLVCFILVFILGNIFWLVQQFFQIAASLL